MGTKQDKEDRTGKKAEQQKPPKKVPRKRIDPKLRDYTYKLEKPYQEE